MRARWNAFWFTPASPAALAVCRIVFYGVLAVHFAGVGFADWSDVSPVFWHPTPSFAALGLGVLPRTPLAIVAATWKLALVTACLGLATRLSTTTCFLLGFYLLGLPNGFGKIHHHDAIVVFVCAILALARSGDALSLDRALRARAAPPIAASGEYTWPLRMVWVLMALLFFGAGVSKLRASGLAWIFSDRVAILLVQAHYHVNDVAPATTFGLLLARHRWICRALAAVVLTGELGYPLALVSRRARRLLVPSVLLMQVGIRVVLGPSFVTWMLCNVFWVPWDRFVGGRRDDERDDQSRVAAVRAAS